ncbi:MAG: amino acid racemase [Bacteroidota bacterium]
MQERKKLGVISGMGTRAGLEFLDKLTNSIVAHSDQEFPEFFVHNNSRIPDRTLSIVYGEASPMPELRRSVDLMNLLGADLVVSTCVTSFYFINQMESFRRRNILNPIDLVHDAILSQYRSVRRVGLLATTGTLQSKLFQHKFKNTSLELITLPAKEQEEKFMRSVYGPGGLKSAPTTQEAYDLFQEAVDLLKSRQVDLIIGGCTEVQLGFNHINDPIPFLGATDVLVDEVIRRMHLKRKKSNKNLVCNE